MKQTSDKAKIYEIVYKLLQAVLYLGVVGISIAYLIFLFMGQEKQILANVELTLLFLVFLLWQADILVRKKLYKSNTIDKKRDKKHTIAVCVALISGIICAIFNAVRSFCNISGPFALAVIIILMLSIWIILDALALEYFFSRKINAEEQADETSSDEANPQKYIEENDQ